MPQTVATAYQVYPINSVLPPGYQPPCRHRHRTIAAAMPCLIKAEKALTREDRVTYTITAVAKGQRRRLDPAEIAEHQELFHQAIANVNKYRKARSRYGQPPP